MALLAKPRKKNPHGIVSTVAIERNQGKAPVFDPQLPQGIDSFFDFLSIKLYNIKLYIRQKER
jgi:hypothetical protein